MLSILDRFSLFSEFQGYGYGRRNNCLIYFDSRCIAETSFEINGLVCNFELPAYQQIAACLASIFDSIDLLFPSQ